MLGCQDFCGYYDWTFHYVRRCWGQEAVQALWARAIGGESQEHYAEGALRGGLRGLYNVWTKTGREEACDWSFTLDEARNVLRCDMRACPSKGFLLENDLNADEDYCDHCMGWVVPLLDRVGGEVLEHEHNHCGQCWMTIAMKDRPAQTLDVPFDIRRDARWNRGYLDRWHLGQKQPLWPAVSGSSDPCEVLLAWRAEAGSRGVALTADSAYPRCEVGEDEPVAVLLGQSPADLASAAQRFLDTPPARRPLLLHAYLPSAATPDFVSLRLPRPLNILPLLIRKGLYVHRPGDPHPTSAQLLPLLAEALGCSLR